MARWKPSCVDVYSDMSLGQLWLRKGVSRERRVGQHLARSDPFICVYLVGWLADLVICIMHQSQAIGVLEIQPAIFQVQEPVGLGALISLH